jgi:hypothetical protein
MSETSPAGAPARQPGAARPGPAPFQDALRYWEPRRVAYNGLLLALVIGWVAATWPHFRPAFTLPNLGRMVVLALLANLCYSAAYPVDLAFQQSAAREAWLRRRGVLWVAGTLFALLFACYWIADEIYPYVS